MTAILLTMNILQTCSHLFSPIYNHESNVTIQNKYNGELICMVFVGMCDDKDTHHNHYHEDNVTAMIIAPTVDPTTDVDCV